MQLLVEESLGVRISRTDYLEALKRAEQKKNYLINRFGDDNGERNKTYYIVQLIAEQLTSMQMTRYCQINHFVKQIEKEHTANHSTLLNQQIYCSTN